MCLHVSSNHSFIPPGTHCYQICPNKHNIVSETSTVRARDQQIWIIEFFMIISHVRKYLDWYWRNGGYLYKLFSLQMWRNVVIASVVGPKPFQGWRPVVLAVGWWSWWHTLVSSLSTIASFVILMTWKLIYAVTFPNFFLHRLTLADIIDNKIFHVLQLIPSWLCQRCQKELDETWVE